MSFAIAMGAGAVWGAEGKVSVIAGSGAASNDASAYPHGEPSGPASEVALGNTFGVEPVGDSLFITTVNDHCVWKLDRTTGEIERVAGSGKRGYSGDGGLATEATFDWPHEVRVDAAGDLFIADTRNHVIRHVDAKTGKVRTICGTGEAGHSLDDGAAIEAKLNQPHSVVLDHAGGVLIADTLNHRLRRVDLATGKATTISGTGETRLPKDGEAAATAPLFGPRSVAVDAESIWIALREGNSVWRIDRQAGTIHHVAGSGKKGYSAEETGAKEATFNGPKGLAIDGDGNVVVSDTENHAIRLVDLKRQTVYTLLGGTKAESTTRLLRPHGVAVDAAGGIIVGDSENHRVVVLGR